MTFGLWILVTRAPRLCQLLRRHWLLQKHSKATILPMGKLSFISLSVFYLFCMCMHSMCLWMDKQLGLCSLYGVCVYACRWCVCVCAACVCPSGSKSGLDCALCICVCICVCYWERKWGARVYILQGWLMPVSNPHIAGRNYFLTSSAPISILWTNIWKNKIINHLLFQGLLQFFSFSTV